MAKNKKHGFFKNLISRVDKKGENATCILITMRKKMTIQTAIKHKNSSAAMKRACWGSCDFTAASLLPAGIRPYLNTLEEQNRRSPGG